MSTQAQLDGAQPNNTVEEESRSSESESTPHPSEGTEGDSNRLDIFDLDQSGLRRSQRQNKPPDRLVLAMALSKLIAMFKPESRKFLYTDAKNLYRDYRSKVLYRMTSQERDIHYSEGVSLIEKVMLILLILCRMQSRLEWMILSILSKPYNKKIKKNLLKRCKRNEGSDRPWSLDNGPKGKCPGKCKDHQSGLVARYILSRMPS